MDTRPLGATGFDVTEVGLGTWNMSPRYWTDVAEPDCKRALRTALDAGINVLDTAEIYGGGRSERIVGEVLAAREGGDRVFVATKAQPEADGGFSADGLAASVDGSRERLGVDALDLCQLHSPATETFYEPAVFEWLERLRAEGAIRHAGVSVETVEEGLKAIEYDVVETVQIMFNPFRQRPAELFFREAQRRNVGVIARVPMASGLLAGAIDSETEFDEGDHRAAAATEGVAAGVGPKGGETFAGVPFDAGVAAVENLREHVPSGATMAQFTLRWILDHDAVSTVVPGSTTPGHIEENVAAAAHPPLSHQTHGAVRDVYEAQIAAHVHHRW